jgi:hypothetical protein
MALSKNTPTAVGAKVSKTRTQNAEEKNRVMDAIDNMFAEFALVYHNQFHKAFADTKSLAYAKRLWFSHLGHYNAQQIMDAARRATQESEYLPTVRGVLKYLEAGDGLPAVREAYREACLAPSPKIEQHWSHPAVYWAGAASDWFFLAATEEKQALPVFERHYRGLCERVARGEELSLPSRPALPAEIHQPLPSAERHAALLALRAASGI